MKERLTGAIILVVLIVLLVPELLSGPSRSAPAPQAAATSSEEPPLRSYTINLADDSHSADSSAGTSNASAAGQRTGAANSHYRVAHAGTARAIRTRRTEGSPNSPSDSSPTTADSNAGAARRVATSAQEQPRPMSPHGSAPPSTQQRPSAAAARAGQAHAERGAAAWQRRSDRRPPSGPRVARESRPPAEASLESAAGWCSSASSPSRRTQSAWRRSSRVRGFTRWCRRTAAADARCGACGRAGGGARGRRAAQRQIAGRGSRWLGCTEVGRSAGRHTAGRHTAGRDELHEQRADCSCTIRARSSMVESCSDEHNRLPRDRGHPHFGGGWILARIPTRGDCARDVDHRAVPGVGIFPI